MIRKINERFLPSILEVPDASSISNLEKVPTDYLSNQFTVFSNSEVR